MTTTALLGLTAEMRERILATQPPHPLTAEQVAEVNTILRPYGLAVRAPAEPKRAEAVDPKADGSDDVPTA